MYKKHTVLENRNGMVATSFAYVNDRRRSVVRASGAPILVGRVRLAVAGLAYIIQTYSLIYLRTHSHAKYIYTPRRCV